MEFFVNVISHLFYFAVGIGVIGYIIHFLNVLFYRLVGNGRAACYASGLIGTPIHELSHALMCIIFRHKITDMKLFQMDDESGTMGYVTHTYTTRSRYQKIGNFFIGVAPIIGGSLVLHLLMRWLLPEEYREISQLIDDFSLVMSDGLSFDIISYSFEVTWQSLLTIFTSFDKGISCIAFLLLGACVALHMKLSSADIKGALPSMPAIVVLVAVVNLVFYGISFLSYDIYVRFSAVVNSVGVRLFATLLLSLCLTVICILIVVLINAVKSVIKAILRR